MSRIPFRLMVVLIWAVGYLPAQQPRDATSIVASFLPPNSSIVKLDRWDPETGNVVSSRPAILQGHILSANSSDIVFAYTTPEGKSYQNALFISLLHQTESGYVKLFEETYYARMLVGQDFETVGLQIVKPPGSPTDLVAVMTQIGASLGGTLEVLRWDDTWGLINVMPENGGVHHLTIMDNKSGLSVTLGYAKSPRERDAPPPRTYRWTGAGFVG